MESNNKPQFSVILNNPDNGKRKKKDKVKKSLGREIGEWVVALLVAVVVVLVLRTFLFTIIRVDGASMNPTLNNGERLFVSVFDVKFGQVERNSVVICHYPNRYSKFLFVFDEMTNFVKRVVGVPGDTVYCENGVTHIINGETGEDTPLDEHYSQYAYTRRSYGAYVLGEDEYFVVGDNRYNSHDSRDWGGPDADESDGGNDGNSQNNVGPITKDMIVGQVRCVFWPLGDIRSIPAAEDISEAGIDAPFPPTH